MSTSTTFATALWQHVFQNAALPNLGDSNGLQPSATAGSLSVALHTADPGVGGTQATNEVAYTGYARATVARSSAGWSVASGVASNAATVAFPQCTGGSATATHFSIGFNGTIIARGALTSSLSISSGILPEFVNPGDLSAPLS